MHEKNSSSRHVTKMGGGGQIRLAQLAPGGSNTRGGGQIRCDTGQYVFFALVTSHPVSKCAFKITEHILESMPSSSLSQIESTIRTA